MEKSAVALEMNHITIEFPGVKALDDVSVYFRRGKVTALMGENGAGKSTLMKILIGLYQATKGEIVIDGQKAEIHNFNDSRKYGIAMIHQELNPVLMMSVAENIFLGREITRGGFMNYQEQNRQAEKMLKNMGIDINPRKKMKDLSVAQLQMVEIVKAVSFDANIIIMDEPTSAITDREVDELFRVIRDLRSQNKTIIYISHKMDEIYEISDDIVVLRDGHFICQDEAAKLSEEDLIKAMVGRNVDDIYPKLETRAGDVFLEVKNASLGRKFHNISFQVRRGEILGIAGLMGAGRTELVEAVFGVTKLDSGEIFIEGEKVKIRSERDAIRRKMALVTEDRKASGLNLGASIRNNISIVQLKKFCAGGVFLKLAKERRETQELSDRFKVKTPSTSVPVKSLSGGNMQKVVLAKWMIGDPDLIIFDEPTRGIDVGSKAEIHLMMSQLAQQGKAVIMISSEMPEVIGMSDRVIVLHEGELTGEVPRNELSQEKLMRLAIGK